MFFLRGLIAASVIATTRSNGGVVAPMSHEILKEGDQLTWVGSREAMNATVASLTIYSFYRRGKIRAIIVRCKTATVVPTKKHANQNTFKPKCSMTTAPIMGAKMTLKLQVRPNAP